MGGGGEEGGREGGVRREGETGKIETERNRVVEKCWVLCVGE